MDKEDKLFGSLESLERAFTENVITLDIYINEKNKLMKEEFEKVMEFNTKGEEKSELEQR